MCHTETWFSRVFPECGAYETRSSPPREVYCPKASNYRRYFSHSGHWQRRWVFFFFLSGRIQDVSQDVTEAMGRWECKVRSTAHDGNSKVYLEARKFKKKITSNGTARGMWCTLYYNICDCLLTFTQFTSVLRKLRFVGLFSWNFVFVSLGNLPHLTETVSRCCRMLLLNELKQRKLVSIKFFLIVICFCFLFVWAVNNSKCHWRGTSSVLFSVCLFACLIDFMRTCRCFTVIHVSWHSHCVL